MLKKRYFSAMQDHVLFIDTETTGLPRNWNASYSESNRWPSAVQMAWIIYTKEGKELKRENFYIKDGEVPISREAERIHGLKPSFLNKYGVKRQEAMKRLIDDLFRYRPLVVGHFVALDYHILGADFYRAALENPLPSMSFFCTMVASSKYVKKPWMKFLRLGELYEDLFGKDLANAHNAMVDAEATAASFFELVNRHEIDDEVIVRQQKSLAHQLSIESDVSGRWILVIGLILLLIAGLIYYVVNGGHKS